MVGYVDMIGPGPDEAPRFYPGTTQEIMPPGSRITVEVIDTPGYQHQWVDWLLKDINERGVRPEMAPDGTPDQTT